MFSGHQDSHDGVMWRGSMEPSGLRDWSAAFIFQGLSWNTRHAQVSKKTDKERKMFKNCANTQWYCFNISHHADITDFGSKLTNDPTNRGLNCAKPVLPVGWAVPKHPLVKECRPQPPWLLLKSWWARQWTSLANYQVCSCSFFYYYFTHFHVFYIRHHMN